MSDKALAFVTVVFVIGWAVLIIAGLNGAFG